MKLLYCCTFAFANVASLAMESPEIVSFKTSSKENIRFFTPTTNIAQAFKNEPHQTLFKYAQALVSGTATYADMQALRTYGNAIVAFIKEICPQIELEGVVPRSDCGYKKNSPVTYLYNKDAQDHLSGGFSGDSVSMYKVDLIDPVFFDKETVYNKIKIHSIKHSQPKIITVHLPSFGCCVALDPLSYTIYIGLFNGDIAVYCPESAVCKKILRYHSKPIKTIRFFFDNYLFVSKTEDELVVWHKDLQKPLVRLENINYKSDHLFKRALVRSLADGWGGDLEYQFPYGWLNGDTLKQPKQFAYIFLLYYIHGYKTGNPDCQLTEMQFGETINYLVQQCFFTGFEDQVARAIQKNLSNYTQVSAPVRFLNAPRLQFSTTSVVFDQERLSDSRYKDFIENIRILLNKSLLEKESQEHLDFLAQNYKAAEQFIQQIIPMCLLHSYKPTSEQQLLYIKDNKSRLQLNVNEVELEGLDIPTKDTIVTKIKINFLPINLCSCTKSKSCDTTDFKNGSMEDIKKFNSDLASLCPGEVDITTWDEDGDSDPACMGIRLPNFGTTIALSRIGIAAVGTHTWNFKGGTNVSIVLIDCTTRKITATVPTDHTSEITGIAFLHNNTCFITHSEDQTYIWRIDHDKPILQLQREQKESELYIYHNFIVSSATGLFTNYDYLYLLPARFLERKKCINPKELAYLTGLLLVTRETDSIKKMKLLTSLYNCPYANLFGQEVKRAFETYLQQARGSLSIVLRDTMYDQPTPRAGSSIV